MRSETARDASVYHLARQLRERGDFEGAMERYRECLASLPPDAVGKDRFEALIGAIHCASGLQAWSEMEALSQQVSEAYPSRAAGPLYLGEALIRQDRHAEAAAALEQATVLDPGLQEAHALLQVARAGAGARGDQQRLRTWPPRVSRFSNLKKLVQRYLIEDLQPRIKIRPHHVLMTLGSCFAENLAKRLQTLGYRVHHEPIGEEVNTTYANRYLLEWLEHGPTSAPGQAMEAAFGAQMRARLREAVAASDVFILTFGVAPCFFDKATGEFAFSWSKSALGREYLTAHCAMRTTTVAENVLNIRRIVEALRRLSPGHRAIVMTVSPVPLAGTTEFSSAFIADCISKSTLRLACHEALAAFAADPRVHYWPSFEIVRWVGPHLGPEHPPIFGADDGNSRHVSGWLVNDIIDLFLERHAARGPPIEGRPPEPAAEAEPCRTFTPKLAWALAWKRDLAACVSPPHDAGAKELLGMLKQASRQGDQPSFLSATRALVAQGPVRPAYALKMARALLDVGEAEAARSLLSADEPSDAMHALFLAQALRGVGRDQEAASAFALATTLGFAEQAPDIAGRLNRALELERRAPALDGWRQWSELICDYLQWGLVERAAQALTAVFARRAVGDGEDLNEALDFALAMFRTASAQAALDLLEAMGELYRRSGLEQDFLDVSSRLRRAEGAQTPRTPDRPAAAHGRKLLWCLAAACASLGRWRMAAWRLGELVVSKRSNDVRADLARCIGQELLQEAQPAFRAPGGPRRIFDLFPYNGEAMMLAIKLNEMAGWVDRFVIVEARTSFTGEAKPIHFEAQRPMFAAFADKITHVVVDAFPEQLNSAWSREFYQRDCAVRGLSGVCAPDDLVLLSDTDEVLDWRALEGFDRDIAPARLRFFQYFLNCEYVLSQPAAQTTITKAKFLARNGSSYLRLAARDREKGRELEGAGWHFSSVDGPDEIGRKMRSFSHQEHAHLDSRHFEQLLDGLRSGAGGGNHLRREIDESFPSYVRENREALARYLL